MSAEFRVASVLAKGHQAHQLTITGLTFPFIDRFWLSAVLDPRPRKYSLYAGAWLIRPGDLLYYYQSDPQLVGGGYTTDEMIRGIRGIYQVVGEWGRYNGPPLSSPVFPAYKIHGKCPFCLANADVTIRRGGRFTTWLCGNCQRAEPQVVVAGTMRSQRFLGLFVRVIPFLNFRRPVPQAVAYGDRTDQPMLWTGRHDNAMGAGKGSTIRHLLPEEALKLTRLLDRQNNAIPAAAFLPPPVVLARPLARNGESIYSFGIDTVSQRPFEEMQLNAEMSLQVRDSKSAIRRILDSLSQNYSFECAISEVPVGYAATTPDYAVVYRHRNGKRLIFLFEFKKANINSKTVAQLYGYLPWIAQMFANEGRVQELVIVPIALGAHAVRSIHGFAPFSFTMPSFRTVVGVEQVCIWEYVVTSPYAAGGGTYAGAVDWADVTTRVLTSHDAGLPRLTACAPADTRKFERVIRGGPVVPVNQGFVYV